MPCGESMAAGGILEDGTGRCALSKTACPGTTVFESGEDAGKRPTAASGLGKVFFQMDYSTGWLCSNTENSS